MRYIFNKSVFILILAFSAFFASCDDRDEEIKVLVTDRLFSAVGVEARIMNQTQVTLTWTKNPEAIAYTLEIFENDSLTFTGEPVMVINNITNADIPYTITTGLVGQTHYSARIKSYGENVGESIWRGIYFRMAAEQILQQVDMEDITATSVLIKWAPNEVATHIVATAGSAQMELALTDDDIEAGYATFTGLKEDTRYTFRLMKDDKIRGTVVAETLMDLTAPGTVVVNTGDDLLAVIQSAAANTRIVIAPEQDGDVFFAGGVTVEINKPLSIRGYKQSAMPVLHAQFRVVAEGASLFVRSVVLDGLSETVYRDHLVQLTVGAIQTGSIIFKDCIITNYSKSILAGAAAINVIVPEFRIENSKVSNILTNSADGIDVRGGVVEKLNLINSSFFNCSPTRDFIRLDDASTNEYLQGRTSIVNVTRCTFSGVSKGASNRLLYIRYGGSTTPLNSTTFNNNLISNTSGYYTNQAATIFTLSKNNYFSAPGYYASEVLNAKLDVAGNYTQINPGFVNETNGDLTITNSILLNNSIGASIAW